jgi:thiamine biosynthesis lipoprotein
MRGALELTVKEGFFRANFSAMASDCEVLLETDSQTVARAMAEIIANEAWRIEGKFSRYCSDNLCARINQSNSQPVAIDSETLQLLRFADSCYQLSDGLFDITSGVLRKAWHFDGSDRLPGAEQVEAVKALVGWPKVHWDEQQICLPAGMELDFGGLGKEYAVDRAMQLAMAAHQIPLLINFGGDLRCNGPRNDGKAWQVGIENPGLEHGSTQVVAIRQGALATSGDAKRFLLKDGQRYSHILNPLTAYPVAGAPRSMTVAAPSCIEAGFLATLAMLQGKDAEALLNEQQIDFWVIR